MRQISSLDALQFCVWSKWRAGAIESIYYSEYEISTIYGIIETFLLQYRFYCRLNCIFMTMSEIQNWIVPSKKYIRSINEIEYKMTNKMLFAKSKKYVSQTYFCLWQMIFPSQEMKIVVIQMSFPRKVKQILS